MGNSGVCNQESQDHKGNFPSRDSQPSTPVPNLLLGTGVQGRSHGSLFLSTILILIDPRIHCRFPLKGVSSTSHGTTVRNDSSTPREAGRPRALLPLPMGFGAAGSVGCSTPPSEGCPGGLQAEEVWLAEFEGSISDALDGVCRSAAQIQVHQKF